MSPTKIAWIIGVLASTAACSYWNFIKWREQHAHSREGFVLTSTIVVMLSAFAGGLILGLPVMFLSLWIRKKIPRLMELPTSPHPVQRMNLNSAKKETDPNVESKVS